jgi:hypothetical protein
METKSVYFSEYVYGVLVGLGLNEEDARRGVQKIMTHFEQHCLDAYREVERIHPEHVKSSIYLMIRILDAGKF